MTRRRIVFVVPGFVVDRNEPGLAAVIDLIERVAAVHDCHVVALRHPSARPRYEVAGATVHALGRERGTGAVGRALVLGRGIREVLAIHRRRPVDLVHGLWADEAGAVATVSARLLRRPAVVSVMGGELTRLPEIGYGAALGRGGRWTAAVALRGADLVMTGSGLARDAVFARRRTRVVLAPLGVDLARFHPSDGERRGDGPGPEAARPYPARILFVGSLEPVKDPAALLRVVAALARERPGLRLDVAGDGRLRPELERLAEALGLTASVRFLGHVPREGMPELYRAASLLLVTSRHEGQSMAAVEAAASGLPVVGTRVGVLPDLGAGAMTVEVGDEAGLIAAAASVLDDPGVAALMGSAGRAAANARFDLDRTSADLMARYEALIGAH